jgi:1,4-dihydroxy-2-naphthoate octaprenyltransferase
MYYLHTGALGAVALLAGAALGALAAAVLVVNNLRDIDSDRRIGKLTLAVRLGRRFSVWEYAALVHAPFGVVALLSLYEPLVLLPWASFLARRLWQEPRGAGLNGVLAATARLGLAFALLLSLAAQLRSSA